MTTGGDSNNDPNENDYIGDVRASLILGVRSSTPDNVVVIETDADGASRRFGSPEALLLSYSNESTPDVTAGGDRGVGSATVDRVLGGGVDDDATTMTTRFWNNENNRKKQNNNNDNDDNNEYDDDDEDEDEEEIVAAYYSLGGDAGGGGYSNDSPPPESVHSGKFTSIAELSPPLLQQHGSSSSPVIMQQQSSSSGGSVGLFSTNSSIHYRGALGGEYNYNNNNNNNNNSNRERSGSQERSLLLTAATTMTNEKKRPPLPPRWAIGSSGVGVGGGGMIDIVPLPPPPKQVMTGGGGEHRRVLSTGDSSFLSNLTDPDSPTPSQQSSSSTIQQQHQSYPPITSTSANATMTLPPTTAVKPLSVVHHRRGVSWANDPIIATSSHSGEEYKTEEEATFDTLGILQPILLDTENEEKNVDVELSTPQISNAKSATPAAAAAAAVDNTNMGNPKSGSAFTASFIAAMNAVSNADTIPRSGRGGSNSKVAATVQQPRTNLWDVVRERKMDILPTTRTSNTSNSKQQQTLAKNSTPNSLGDVAKELSRQNRIRSQFGNEVDQLILGALSTHNLTMNDAPTVVDVRLSEEFGGDETERANHSPPPLTVLPVGHSKHVSALTWTDVSSEPSPKNGVAPALGSRQQGESVIEDDAWTPAYDTLGRIDGTLPEERDPKLLITTEVPWGADDVNTAIATKPPPPTRPVRTSTDGSKRSNDSSRSKSSKRFVEDGSTSIKDNIEISTNNVQSNPDNTSDPTENTGLRHRKTKTIAAKSMADELAELAAKSGGGHRHQQTMFTTTGGVDDLFAGVEFIAGQHARAEEEHERRKDRPTAAAHVDDNKDNNDGGDASHDEEIGGASPGKDPLDDDDDDAINDDYRETHVRKKSSLRQQVKFQMRSYYSDLIKPKLPLFWEKTTRMMCFIMLPLLFIAIVLFYGAGNPMLGSVEVDNELFGRNETAQVVLGVHVDTIHKSASWSWWVLFILRQVIVLSCVKTGEVIAIDILALRTPLFFKTFGWFTTLMIVQSRGWPFVLTFWSISDFCFLYGSHGFAKHWLFWQSPMKVFNESNPSGDFVGSNFYLRLLLAMFTFGFTTALKRLWLGTFLGRRSYTHYSSDLNILLAKMLLISQVAHLAREIDHHTFTGKIGERLLYPLRHIGFTDTSTENNTSPSKDDVENSDGQSPTKRISGYGKTLLAAGICGDKIASNQIESTRMSTRRSSSISKKELTDLLKDWEEPDYKTNAASKASITDVLQYRQAIAAMDDNYPFTPAFGLAKSRATCVDSSDRLYDTLLKQTVGEKLLPFETLSEICYDSNRQLNRDKAKALIKLFRPDRLGYLTKLDFVSTIDDVYKDLRLFRASLANSSSIDDVFGMMINTGFYVIQTFVVLIILGFNHWAPLTSIWTFFLSLAFMFGSASSTFFEGILMIFVRRPYDIGDKISLSNPSTDTNSAGSSTWFVENVTLFTTTVRYASTNEVATYSNGSLARLRIVNAKRSPKACVCVYMKFGTDAPFKMIQVFRTAIEKFIQARPREWVRLNTIRATRVEIELNYVEYVIDVTHREMWQNIGPIKQSQADLASFSLEITKKLGLKYTCPPKPIHLSFSKAGMKPIETTDGGDGHGYGLSDVAEMFEPKDGED